MCGQGSAKGWCGRGPWSALCARNIEVRLLAWRSFFTAPFSRSDAGVQKVERRIQLHLGLFLVSVTGEVSGKELGFS